MERSQLDSYMSRIGMETPAAPTLAALKEIQERHIGAVPVENLDIIHGRLPLSLATDDLFDKVVVRRRGGISFELNLFLAEALRDLGFGVKLMSARHPRYGHEFDHAFLMASVPGEAGEWLVDVGFTEGIPTPLLFDARLWQGDGHDEFTFRADGAREGAWQLVRRCGDEEGLVYSFELKEHEPAEYEDQCTWFCMDEDSRFTQGPFVFVQRPEGRLCLSMDTVENLRTGEQVRPVIKSRAEGRAVLSELFGLEFDGGASDEPDGKFGFKRVFAALDEDGLEDAVIERAARIAIAEKAHVRFGHVVKEPEGGCECGFPAYIQSVREHMNAVVAAKLAEMGAADDLFGGEVVVVGSGSLADATIDEPVNYAPEQLVESLVKPFEPDVVVCGDPGKSKLRSFLHGNAGDYLARKLDCEVVKVASA